MRAQHALMNILTLIRSSMQFIRLYEFALKLAYLSECQMYIFNDIIPITRSTWH